MKKFTLVAPTMWRYMPFLSFLADLVEYDFVDEIILINNNSSSTPNHWVLNHSKIKLINFPQNIFVNPAFNIGVQLAKNEYVCLINDDVVFDIRIFLHVSRLPESNLGSVGLCPGSAEYRQPPFESGIIKIIPWNSQHTFGYGSVMFVLKSQWHPIPSGLKLYYGDNWIFDTAMNLGRINYIITDSLHHTPYATTVKNLSNKELILEHETTIYTREFEYWCQVHLSMSEHE